MGIPSINIVYVAWNGGRNIQASAVTQKLLPLVPFKFFFLERDGDFDWTLFFESMENFKKSYIQVVNLPNCIKSKSGPQKEILYNYPILTSTWSAQPGGDSCIEHEHSNFLNAEFLVWLQHCPDWRAKFNFGNDDKETWDTKKYVNALVGSTNR